MKKIVAIFCAFICLCLSGCSGNVTPEQSTEMKEATETVKGAFGEQYVKKPLRMLNIDGELYYDSGLVSDTKARCGVMDWKLDKVAEIGEVPKESGTSNFTCEGCQFATKITCEVLVDGEWLIFKKFENQVGETKNLAAFPYCFYIKGRMNNAAIDTELAVLTDDPDITFSDVFEPLLSSQYLPDAPKKALSFDFVQSGDPWGISCFVKDLTNHGMTFQIEQFGGTPTGELETGEWFCLYRMENDKWVPVETDPLIDYVFPAVAYPIAKNDITEFEIEWEWLYGELPSGYYRLDKEVMDFRASGDFDEKTYLVMFTIE